MPTYYELTFLMRLLDLQIDREFIQRSVPGQPCHDVHLTKEEEIRLLEKLRSMAMEAYLKSNMSRDD